MNHLHRISWILGTLLLGASAALLYNRDGQLDGSARRSRRGAKTDVPVDKLADSLKQAWAGYHTP